MYVVEAKASWIGHRLASQRSTCFAALGDPVGHVNDASIPAISSETSFGFEARCCRRARCRQSRTESVPKLCLARGSPTSSFDAAHAQCRIGGHALFGTFGHLSDVEDDVDVAVVPFMSREMRSARTCSVHAAPAVVRHPPSELFGLSGSLDATSMYAGGCGFFVMPTSSRWRGRPSARTRIRGSITTWFMPHSSVGLVTRPIVRDDDVRRADPVPRTC